MPAPRPPAGPPSAPPRGHRGRRPPKHVRGLERTTPVCHTPSICLPRSCADMARAMPCDRSYRCRDTFTPPPFAISNEGPGDDNNFVAWPSFWRKRGKAGCRLTKANPVGGQRMFFKFGNAVSRTAIARRTRSALSPGTALGFPDAARTSTRAASLGCYRGGCSLRNTAAPQL